MQRNLFVLVSLVLIVSLTACRGRRRLVAQPSSGSFTTVQSAPPTAGETIILDGVEIIVAEGDVIVADGVAEEVVEATPEAGAAADDLLGEASNAARIESDRRAFLIDQYAEKGDQALAAGDQSSARQYFMKVLDLDAGNAHAAAELARLSSDRPSTVAGYTDERRSVELVRRQKAAQEVKNHLERGRSLEVNADFAGAVKEYQKSLAIISWYDETADFGVSGERIRDLIDQTKYKSELAARNAKQEQLVEAQRMQEEEMERERGRRLGRIQAYFKEANNAFRQGDYALAREYLRQVMRLDPDNTDAEKLIACSYDAEHIERDRNSRAEFDDQWKRVMKQLEYDTLPQVRTVEFPEDWLDEIAHRKPRMVGDDVDGFEDESTAALVTALDKKRVKGLAWQEASLDDVVAYLRTITGLNFVITAKAREEKGEDVVVDLELTDVSVSTILDIVTEQHELKWLPQGGVIKIALPDEVSGTMRLRYFDVKDLNVAIKDFVGQEINLTPSNFTPLEPPELDDPVAQFPADSLPDLIQQTIGEEGTWDDPASIDVRNGILIVRNTPEILGQIGNLLDELRRNTGILVNLEVRFLAASDNFLRDVGVDLRGLGDNSQGVGAPGLGTPVVMDDVFFGSPGNPQGVPFGVNPEPSSVGTANDAGIFYNDGGDGAYAGRVENLFDTLLGNPDVLTGSGGASFQTTFIDDTEMEVILRAVEKSERLQEITAPRITVYNTQRANVQVLNQVAYVADYEVEIAQASNIANPVVQTILDGVVLDVRPVVSADRRFIMLEMRPTVANLTRPIATFSTSLASGPVTASAPVIIQIPELQVSRVRTTVNMPDGGTLLLGGLKFYEEQDLDVGTPILSDIPILGFLFSRKGHFVNRRDMIILIKAKIIDLEELEPKDDLDIPDIPLTDWVPVIGPTPVVPVDNCAPPPPPEPDCGCGPGRRRR